MCTLVTPHELEIHLYMNDIYMCVCDIYIYLCIFIPLYTINIYIYIYKPCFCCFSSQTPSLVHMGSTMSQTVADSRRVVLVWGCITWQPRSLPLNIEVAIVAEPRFGSTWHLVEDTYSLVRFRLKTWIACLH